MTLPEVIASALAPGIALNSIIFFNNGLQTRFTSTTGRIRELNAEARALAASSAAINADRLASIRKQVELLLLRAQKIRQAMVILLLGVFGMIGAIISLLLVALQPLRAFQVVAGVAFGSGLIAMAIAVWMTWTEVLLSQLTVIEDSRSSHSRE